MEIPVDVLPNIFIRLPAKQLVQMRCISKYWKAFLSQSSFVKHHLDHSIGNKDRIFLVFWDNFYLDTRAITAHSFHSLHLELPNFIKLPVRLRPENGNFKIIGSINGLICFKYGPDRNTQALYIWNPSLSTFLTLPPYSMRSPCYVINFEFGFDPKTDDYKIVKHSPVLSNDVQVEVYSMRKGSWKSVAREIPSHFTFITDQRAMCLDGHLHWLCFTDFISHYLQTILAFDLGAETFHEIPFPHFMPYEGFISNYLGVLGGKLCVMSKVGRGECVVWVMEEYGVAESWVKRHVFPLLIDDLNPYGFTLHNEYLSRGNQGLALYDLVTGKAKIFKVRGGVYRRGQGVEYVDSLVWVTPDENREMSCCLTSVGK